MRFNTQYYLDRQFISYTISQSNKFIHLSGRYSGNQSNWKSSNLIRNNNDTFTKGKNCK